jgi:hypothetical protein
MTSFDTPEPIDAIVEIGAGNVHIAAGDRADTVVRIRPSRASRRSDVSAAEQTTAEFAAGRLTVASPRRAAGWFSGGGAVDVHIELPAGSRFSGKTGAGTLRADGWLAECRFTSGAGELTIDQVGAARLDTGAGDVVLRRVTEHAELATGSGAVRVDELGGGAIIKNSNGSTMIGVVSGELRVQSANGKIMIARAEGTVSAKTANGAILIEEARRGSVVAESANGTIEIGVRDGTAAWLDLSTHHGRVRNELAAAPEPEPNEERVELRVSTGNGNVTIRRRPAPRAAVGLEKLP